MGLSTDLEKAKVCMSDGILPDKTPQQLYFPEGHECAGLFKGMANILQERGFNNAHKLRAECKSFKCSPPALDCCCRRVMFNQLDFAHVDTILEGTCNARRFKVIF